jgi:hypothetical protein
MKSQHTALAVALAAALSLGAAVADAQTNYNFGTSGGTPTTLQGATFSSPQDATTPGGAFTFTSNPGFYSNITGNVLTSSGYAATLDISFAQAQTGLSFQFAGGNAFDGDGASDLLTVTANTGQTWTVQPGLDYAGFLYPVGLFAVAGASAFTSVAITETYVSNEGAGGLTTDSLTIGDMTSTPVPVPASVWFLASGLAGLGWGLRRKQAAA